MQIVPVEDIVKATSADRVEALLKANDFVFFR